MRCKDCGHEYPDSLIRCRKCGSLAPRGDRSQSQSRLIEFPRISKAGSDKSGDEQPLSPWREELHQRIQEIKSRRTDLFLTNRSEAPDSPDSASGHIRSATGSASHTPESNEVNPVIEAAIQRIINPDASTGLPSLHFPSKQPASNKTSSYPSDRQATARILAPPIERDEHDFRDKHAPVSGPSSGSRLNKVEPASIHPGSQRVTFRSPEQALQAAAAGPAPDKFTRVIAPSTAPASTGLDQALLTPSIRELPRTDDEPAYGQIEPFDYIEPADYLEAEIKRVDRSHEPVEDSIEAPSIISYVLSLIVDMVIITASTAPFWALVTFTSGDFNSTATRISVVLAFLVVGFYYLALTHCACGRTFGMMLVNTHIVDSETLKPITPQRALMRAIGYFIAALPLTLGLLWALFNRRHRGWQDIISGTLVVRDF